MMTPVEDAYIQCLKMAPCPLKPTEVRKKLHADGFKESEVRSAFLQLWNRGAITADTNWLLRLSSETEAAYGK